MESQPNAHCSAARECGPALPKCKSQHYSELGQLHLAVSGNNDGDAIGVNEGTWLQIQAGNFKEIETTHFRLVRAGIRTGPGIEAKMVVVVIPGNKHGLLIQIDH